MVIAWNTGLAAERARHNLKLKIKKKVSVQASKRGRVGPKIFKLDKSPSIGYYKIMKKYWLLDYFIRDKKDLAPSYVKKVERFLKCSKKKPKK